MSHLREGAWSDAHTGQWSFIDEHSESAKPPGDVSGIGLLDAVREAIEDIPTRKREVTLENAHPSSPD